MSFDSHNCDSETERQIKRTKELNSINIHSKFFYDIDYDEEL